MRNLLTQRFLSSKSPRLVAAIILVFGLSLADLSAQWVQSCRSGGIAYFLFASYPRLERFSLTNGQWLAPISLPSIYGLPSVFTVDADGIYVAYNTSVKRYSLQGDSEQQLLNTAYPVQGLYTDGNLILINYTSYLYARFASLNKFNGTVIATMENYVDSVYGASIAPGLNKVFGRSQGISPADITYVSYNDDGTFNGGGDSPHHGDYPDASRTWVFPGEAKVVDSSGTVYNTGNLTYMASFGGSINDLDFYGPDIPIVLRGSELIAYSNSLLPMGSRTLSAIPKNIYVNGTNVLAFISDTSQANGIRVDTIPLATLNPPTPGQPVNPNGLAYTPDSTFLDKNGVLYLFSKAQQSLFRWDTLNQKYLTTIPLVAVPSYAAYSPTTHKAYLAYSSGLIRQLDLNSTNLTETPFASLATAPEGLSTADGYVFAMDGSGAWGTHYTFDPAGTKVASVDWNYYSTEFIWSSVNQKMYFFRDDTSPNDLLWEQINADGRTYTNEPPGGIGGYMDSPLHDSAGFVHPIRVSPDGSIVVLGSGVIHNAVTLERLTLSLANAVTDIAWLGTQLRTVRTISGLAQFQQWTAPNYGLGTVRQVPGTAQRLLALSTNQLLSICLQNGMPAFYVLDSNFNIIAPPTLEPPSQLAARVSIAPQVSLTWNDINGEESYAIERRTGTAGSWTQIGTASTSATNYIDGTVAMGNVYSYRVLARNGNQSSVPSPVVTAVLAVPEVPTNFTVTAVSSNLIGLAWSDVQYETNYFLERKTGAAGTWVQIAALPAETSTFTNSSLTPYTDYYYRLRAANGVGVSAYTPAAGALTDPVPPTVPSLTSATATGPFSVALAWSNASYEDNYVVERRSGTNGPWAGLSLVGRDVTSFLDNTVVPVTAYEYRLYATNIAGVSGYSNSRLVTTPQIPPPPAPAGLLADALSRSSVRVTWNDVAGETGYRLERRNESTNSWAVIAVLPANTVSFTNANLVQGMQYFYRVQAFNDYGNSPYSNEEDAVPVDIVNLVQDDFDPELDATVWANVTGGIATNGGAGFRTNNKALWFSAAGERSASTVALDVSRGGTLQFLLRAGNEALDGNTCWNNSESGETVVLEYSKDGANWSALQTLNTVYPALSNWTSFKLSVPAAAFSLQTQFRWRQLANSGPGFDCWALDDLSVQAVAPPPPVAPPFLISSANSSSSVGLYWAAVDGATSYLIERKQELQNWVSLAAVAGSATWFTDFGALPSTAYAYRVKAANAGGVSPSSLPTTCVTWSQQQDWIYQNYGSLDALSEQELQSPGPDGIVPLLRYAFNLSATESCQAYQPGQSTSGAPAIWLDQSRSRLCIEFVRRKASGKPGISYTVQYSSSLGGWAEGGSLVSSTSIDTLWERVRYEEGLPAGKAMRFYRVAITPQ